MSARRSAATPVRSIYVHAPFCARRCVYCDFAVTVRRSGDVDGWLGAVRAEWSRVEEEGLFSVEQPLETLYVGGGTPSLLGAPAMAGLASVVGAERLRGERLEWTAEANPESFGDEIAEAWARAGVNRLSLGVQTFHEPALRWMGRLHGPAGAVRAVDAARSAGIDNVSLDLIFGLPASLDRSWRDDLRRALALDVPHISLYGLTVEDDTALGRAVRSGREPPVEEDRYREEFLEAAEVLSGHGYLHYEVSNFARPGFEARHNAVYWSGKPYLGIGNAAHSYAPPVRRWNTRSWQRYRERADAGRSPEEGREVVNGEAADLERAWLALRTRSGVETPPDGSGRAALVDGWVRDGLAVERSGRVMLTADGWLMLDRLAVAWADAGPAVADTGAAADRWVGGTRSRRPERPHA